MTAHKHFKQLVRARMGKTGESYTTARRQIIQQARVGAEEGPGRWHLPGSIPAATALRILLTAAGVRDPRTGAPFSEAMVFGICGGIGLGIASFYYAAADFSSFYIAGRHLWHDHLTYLKQALGRFGITPVVRETSGAKGAMKQLRDALEDGPCIAWVDGYHVLTVYGLDETKGIALIGDLADEPTEMSLERLAEIRSRIKQYKNRLLSVPASVGAKVKCDPDRMIRAGLTACYDGLKKGPAKGAAAMSGLERIRKWAEQLQPDSKGKDSWRQMFPRGHRLWQGLTSIHEFVEHQHTGGGLCRPMFAEFLADAAEVPGWGALKVLSKTYAELGERWSDLAMAALPAEVAAFRKAREICGRRAELKNGGEEMRGCEQVIEEQKEIAKREFPLSQGQCDELLESLHEKVMALYQGEVAAHAALGEVVR
jgi:hypothetical protein